jgi:hypothetical protein
MPAWPPGRNMVVVHTGMHKCSAQRADTFERRDAPWSEDSPSCRSYRPRFALGGFEIVDLTANQAIYQVLVELWTDSGSPMTCNPFWIEAATNGPRAYFMPQDEKSTLHIYQAEVM